MNKPSEFKYHLMNVLGYFLLFAVIWVFLGAFGLIEVKGNDHLVYLFVFALVAGLIKKKPMD